MTVDTPTIKVFVDTRFLYNEFYKPVDFFLEGYLVAVRCVPSRALLFTVHLENGALWSGLPIEALYKDLPEERPVPRSNEILQPWSCLESPVNVIQYRYMKDQEAIVNSPDIQGVNAEYLFTIDYHGEGLAQDPEQHKTHNILRLRDSGQLCAMPNNYLVFQDGYQYDTRLADTRSKLRRHNRYFKAGG